MQRVEQSLKNTVASLGIQLGTILLNFISRTVLIKTLGEEYLGINGLFVNILTMLSLVEMGVGSALIYLMYKPMAENDEKKLALLMRAYAKIYTVIGVVIFALGVIAAPFLKYFMKEVPDIKNLTLIYVLYVLNMALTYLLSYRASIINVAQKSYIVNLTKFGFVVLQYAAQIVVLIVFKNYVFYYLCLLLGTVLGNVAVHVKAGRMFPFIKQRTKEQLSKEEKNEIKKSVMAMSFHRLGSFVVFGTDNLIISKFLGVVAVGLYSNYVMIINALWAAVNLIFSSITASIGNLVNHEDTEKSHAVFKNVFFATSWLAVFCSVCMCVLFNPFIELWLGKDYTFSILVVLVIVFNFFLSVIRMPANIFKETLGLFWNDRYKSVIEAIVNLVFSVILVKQIGILGVFVGTTISTVAVCLWVEPRILYKHYFKRPLIEYFIMLFKYLFVGVVSTLTIWGVAYFVNFGALGTFAFKMALCMIVPNLLFVVLFYRKSEFRYFVQIFSRIVSKFKR